MKLIGFDTRGILCGREGQMVTSKSGTVGFLQQIARQNHVVPTSELKVGSLICVASLNARMKLIGSDRRGILYGSQAQVVPSKSRAVEFLQQIDREYPVLSTNQLKFGPLICAAAVNARCSTDQTQVITVEAPIITHLPGEEKSLELDEGGSGFPPDDGDSGGGGGNWWGGFFFFGFLAFLGFLVDKENGGLHWDEPRRILVLMSQFSASLTRLYVVSRIMADGLLFNFAMLCIFCISAIDWEAICFCFSVLVFILKWVVPFVVHVLPRYNITTGLTGRGASDDLLSQPLNWRYRSADSSAELTNHTNGNNDPMAENTECCICLADYEDNEEIQMLPCSHVFHLKCVDRWLRIKSFCPLCKQNIRI